MPLANPVRVGRQSTLIATVTVSTAVTSIVFASVPTGYTDLYVRFDAITSDANNQYVQLRFNGDTGANYGTKDLRWGPTNNNDVYPTSTYIICGRANSSAIATSRSSGEMYVWNYLNTTFHKWTQGQQIMPQSPAASAPDGYLIYSKWHNTAAISTVTYTMSAGDFVAGSVFSLYGVTV